MADRSNFQTRQPVSQMTGNNPFFEQEVEWSTGLFDCCSDGNAMNDCCVATHCGLCAAVQMKSELMSRGLAQ
ncbi:unnamed protein product [Adineta steineri]|uniref:Uncharacterized protein n=1 Tax=Adineta steineri TaxID=433720 RepID=A0A815RZ10_9BILA|nr:unnamed protein product [Adineta steineri]CAF1484910.1 unnamed protein product [Adineta steineri]CAF3746174.1 unnamed protein product [Adineta steineri]CAF3757109.1 unnamed protein product [Adineta steineri]